MIEKSKQLEAPNELPASASSSKSLADAPGGSPLEAAISGTSHRVKAARAKLKRVRDSLDLEASKPPYTSRNVPGRASQRATASQRKVGARLRESQKRRAKIVSDRKAVRNYAFPSPTK